MIDGDPLTLCHRTTKDNMSPEYISVRITGEAGGYVGFSHIEITTKRSASYHTFSLDAQEGALLRDWLIRHVDGPQTQIFGPRLV